MTGDNMEIIHPVTGGVKGFVDSNNEVQEKHDCIFTGNHSPESGGLDVDDTCTICGKTLGDLIAEDFDPTDVKVPIIIVPGGHNE